MSAACAAATAWRKAVYPEMSASRSVPRPAPECSSAVISPPLRAEQELDARPPPPAPSYRHQHQPPPPKGPHRSRRNPRSREQGALLLGQRGVAGALGQPPGKRPQHLALDLRVPVEQGVELPGCQHEQAYGGLDRHRRRARQLGDQGDLTHEVAAAHRRDPPALPADLDLAVDEHEELVPDLALLAQDPARFDLQVLAEPLPLDELPAGKVLEEGDALERLHLGVLAEQPHGANPSSGTPAGASRLEVPPCQVAPGHTAGAVGQTLVRVRASDV